jgi:hypothetical protein
VKEKPDQQSGANKAGSSNLSPSPIHFYFGSRRHETGQRRLFVPQQSTVDPSFLQTLERPHAIMRVVTGTL